MIPLLRSPETLSAFGESASDGVDTAMELLAHRHRRSVLQYLEDGDGSATLTELAVEIAAREAATDPNAISDHGDVSARDRRSARISLHHTHIPKLAAADVIDYESETETVTLAERGRTLLERDDAIRGLGNVE
ncbi:hypothetical protein ACFR99_01930 [Haloarchaeobius amylolyticus]|uniref:DUF7344 domain-containing protein n=1 Tax=Haloarchaeobius amylolyticus TaxID=1198296 RepID=A0ABD6BCR1_9EURY